MNLIDKFIKQFFTVFAVMLMLGGGFLANTDNLLFLQKVEASEVRDISNLSAAEKTAVYVYRTISSFFSSTEETGDSNQNEFTDDSLQFTDETPSSLNEDEISRGLSSGSEADRGETSGNVPSVPTTVVTNPIREIIKETVVERVTQTSGITLEDLQKLNNELRSEIYKLSSATNSQITNTYQVISASNNIDNLGGVEIYDSNITNSNASGVNLNYTNGSISNLTVGSAVFDTDTLFVDSVNNRVGIGTTTPSSKLDIYQGNLNLDNTTNANQYGVISKGGTRFIHNFNYGDNGTVTTDGYNTFVGIEAGNLTMGSTATETYHSSYNTTLGFLSLSSNTTGDSNTANGYVSLYSNTTGYSNTANGAYSLYSNTTGDSNTANGYASIHSNTTGFSNTANGMYSLYFNTTGNSNTANGYQSLFANTTGSNNIAFGTGAGRYQADGTTALTDPENSVYLGYGTRGFSNADSNSIVIGYNATGIGSNSVVLGNDSITTTALKGNVGIGTVSPIEGLQVEEKNIMSIDLSGGSLKSYRRDNSVVLNNSLGNFSFGVYTTADSEQVGARLEAISEGTWSAGSSYPTALRFSTVQSGSTSLTERIRLSSDGNVGIGTTSPLAKLSVKGAGTTTGINFQTTNSADTPLVTVLDSGNVGIGTASPSAKLSIVKTGNGVGVNSAVITSFGDNTDFSSSGMQGFRSTAYHDGDGNINWVYGAFSDARVYGSGNTQEIKGSVNKGTFYGNGNVTTIIGTESSGFAASGLENSGVSNISNIYGMKVAAYGGAMSGSTANIDNIYGIYSEAGSGVWGSSGNVTNAYNIYLNNYENGGASVLANQYQLYIETPNKGSSNNYSIYSQGGTNYFAGNIGIGTTSPFAKLSVSGDGYFDGNITVSNITATSSIYLANATNANQAGIIYKNNLPFIHNFNYGNNGTATTDGYNTFVGQEAGNLTMGSTATSNWESSANTGIGYKSLNLNTIGYDNSALGYKSLYSNTGGYGNNALGYYSLYSNTTGGNNTADGYWSMYNNTDGSNNVAMGFFSLWANTSGGGNTAIGDQAMVSNIDGYGNVAVGQTTMYNNTSGFLNVAVGQSALYSKTTGNYNIGLGYRAGYGVTTASNNLFLGNQAGDNVTTGASNLIIGYNVDAPSATASNQLNIGNLIYGTGIDGTGTTLSTGNIGIGTTSPNYKLTVTGTVGFNALPNDGTGYYLCAKTGTGELATSTTACGASSERFKTNINDLTYGLDTVLQLRPVSFNWKSDFINSSSTQIGFIAEEVNTLIPEVIGKDNSGTIMNLDYPKLTSVLVSAMQELVNTLDERVISILSTISNFVADKITARQEICIDNVCINKDQLKTLLENNGIMPASVSTTNDVDRFVPREDGYVGPVITITGNNPAIVEINSTYADLGATAVDSQGHSLIVDTIDADKVDTTIAGEYTVTYTTFDGTNTSTTTRRVIVEELIADSLQPIATPLELTTASSSLPLTGQATPLETTTASSSLPLTGEPVIEPIATTTEPTI
ncbi:MAG: tail fiber domain-containing protein [Candidatus Pacebacteria bacterium]|nr:tail fiber domain-containing protein [Candidatus Paceibacterota bacterium]